VCATHFELQHTLLLLEQALTIVTQLNNLISLQDNSENTHVTLSTLMCNDITCIELWLLDTSSKQSMLCPPKKGMQGKTDGVQATT
jgi:hypothetical protein